MDAIMALCKRRGFVFQASDIYGGINGFWDYGPLGAQLKKNLREAWWQDMIMNPCWGRKGPNGERVRCVPLETCIIQHPKVWEASGHVGGFNDPMVDCKETKGRYRYDHVMVYVPENGEPGDKPVFAYVGDQPSEAKQKKKAEKTFGAIKSIPLSTVPQPWARVIGPDAEKPGTLTEPRMFNLMFDTIPGAIRDEANKAYLRPETAQGVFLHFKNVVDSTRVRIPFGIGNTGRSFRNEVTPRNFTFRSREFEQAELEFFCHPDESFEWYKFWRDFRMEWWQSIGLKGENLILREHDKDELSHYSVGTSDVEYRFPFTAPGFGELEGIAHRGNYDLAQHQTHSKVKLDYFDTTRGETLPNGGKKGERYIPHCIEPAAGLDRGALALICEAYTVDPSRPSPEILKLHPRVAPIKAAVFPLVDKDGMPEVAERLADELFAKFGKGGFIETDAKQSIGKRYARMDEAGCPFCFTIDGDTLKDQTVTVRDRDTGQQQRLGLDKVSAFLGDKLGV
jgi:glycyl-tRNA synthetase